jgi:hypothetical protein
MTRALREVSSQSECIKCAFGDGGSPVTPDGNKSAFIAFKSSLYSVEFFKSFE